VPDVYGTVTSIRQQAAGTAGSVLARHAADVDANGRFPEESIAALAQGGLLGLCVPQAHGGMGQGPRAFAAVAEELAQECSSTAMVFVMHVAATQAIAASPTLRSRDDLLRTIASGKHLTTLAFSESGSRSQFWAPVSRLVQSNGSLTVSAQKSWVTAGEHADSYVASAQKPDASSALESTLFLVKRKSAGVRAEGGFDGLGLRGNNSVPVKFDGLDIPAESLLTSHGEGATMMLQVVLPWFNVGTAGMANGLCRAAVGATAAHMQTAGFAHTGTALRDLPTLRARLAEMSTKTEQARALLGYTLGELEAPSETTPLFVLQTRLASLEAALEVTDLAMKACGGAAFSRHLPLERLFRDARAGWVMAPTVDHLREFTGRALTGLPLF
jgi:alkylation response protein AidB-like acyl-CoA dehydrogenase